MASAHASSSRSGPSLFGGPAPSTSTATEPTFRHLLSSSSLGPSNPLRVIAHVDVDAAYVRRWHQQVELTGQAQFEMKRLGLPEDIPVAVQQWQGLIAINYPARAFGLSRHINAPEALKKCPELTCVHVATYKEGETQPGYFDDAKPETHKVSLDLYRREGAKILGVFTEFCPTVEKASIDESFFDLTVPVRALLLERYPELKVDAKTLPKGLDTPLPPPPTSLDWEAVGYLVPATEPEPASADGEAADKGKGREVEEPITWHDVALSLGASIMLKCRASVRERLGYTTSAGVARNKALAKLCSAYRKPNAQTILRNAAIPAFLRPLPYRKIRFLGGKLGASVNEAADGINTIGDLWTVSLSELSIQVGAEQARWVYDIARGIDESEVVPKTAVKSMLSSKNVGGLRKDSEILYWLNVLANELTVRLSGAREEQPGLWPKTINLSMRSDAYVIRSKQTAFPYTSRLTAAYILKFAEKLFREHRADDSPAISNLALSFQGLERTEAGQGGLERFLSNDKAAPKSSSKKRARSITPVASEVIDLDDDDDDDLIEMPTRQWACSRCKKSFAVPDDGTGKPSRFEIEHADEHFARDLSASQRVQIGPSPYTREVGGAVRDDKKVKTGALPKDQGTLSAMWAKPKASGGGAKSGGSKRK